MNSIPLHDGASPHFLLKAHIGVDATDRLLNNVLRPYDGEPDKDDCRGEHKKTCDVAY